MDSIDRAAVSRARSALDLLQHRPYRTDSDVLVRAVEGLISNPHSAPRYDRETAATVERWHEECAIEDAHPRSLCVPFKELAGMAVQRDLNTSIITEGGGLVSTHSSAVDALRPWSVTGQAGVTIVPNVRSNQVLPAMVTDPTIAWSGGSESVPALAASVGAPKIGTALVRVSRKLRLQSNVGEFLASQMLRIAGRAIDQAVLGGNGVDGAPIGVAYSAGTDSMTGASITHAVIVDGKRDASLTGAPSGSWISTPTVRALLEQREVVSTSGRFVWADDRMASWPAHATPDCPTGFLLGGYWPSVVVLLYGSGVTLSLNPYNASLFAAGTVEVKVEIPLDVLVVHPAAFTVASSVT